MALRELHPEIALDEAVDVAVEHGAGVADFEAGPRVLHQLIRLEDIRANLAAEADLSLIVIRLGIFRLALLFLQPNELCLLYTSPSPRD